MGKYKICCLSLFAMANFPIRIKNSHTMLVIVFYNIDFFDTIL